MPLDLTPAEKKTMEQAGLTPGPDSQLADAVDTSPMPISPALVDDGVDLKMLTPEEIRVRLTARERDMKFRVDALKREVMTVGEDITFDGRPLFDVVRGAPLQTIAIVGGSGIFVGVILGLLARRRKRLEPDFGALAMRARVASMIDEAADYVRRGHSADDAIRRSTKSFPVYMPQAPAANEAAAQAKSSVRQAVDFAVKSAAGFAVKAATDQVKKSMSGGGDAADAT